MKLIWHGHSCFEMDFANGPRVIADPFDEKVGYPVCRAEADVVTNSHAHGDHNYVAGLSGDFARLNRPGRFAFEDLTVTGIKSFHDAEGGARRGPNIIFIYEAEGLRIAHLGDLGHMPDDAQFAALSGLDLMLIPIGGYYTIDTRTAVEVIRRAKPRVAVAMHFLTPVMNFPISDEKQFVELTVAKYACAQEIEITRENVGGLPGAIVLEYPRT
jgi:L-ascorbate metabolism protein UlaG (beta-lactamase superfamily)